MSNSIPTVFFLLIDVVVTVKCQNGSINAKGRRGCLACNQRLFVALRQSCTHLKLPATDALMASLMGSEDFHREVGQRETVAHGSAKGRRRKCRRKGQTRGTACEIFIVASCMLCCQNDTQALSRDCSALNT